MPLYIELLDYWMDCDWFDKYEHLDAFLIAFQLTVLGVMIKLILQGWLVDLHFRFVINLSLRSYINETGVRVHQRLAWLC